MHSGNNPLHTTFLLGEMKGIKQRNSLFCTKYSYSMAEIEIYQTCKANWRKGKERKGKKERKKYCVLQ
jgi:hypothetical protein